MQAVYAGLDVAHERVPEPKRHKSPAVPKIPAAQSSRMQSATGPKNKNATKSHHQSGEQMKPPKLDLAQMQSNSRGRSTVPEKPRGKRELQRDQERPAWDSEIPRAPSRKPSTTVRVKEEPSEAPVPRRIKQEHEVQASRTSLSTFQRTLQLAIDYYLGFHLTKSTYPELLLKAKFANDALIRSAQDQDFTAILARLTGDKDYRESLATVLSGRVSSFRGSVKITATSILYGKYAYIYPHKPDKIDPRTQLPIAGKPNTKKPFMHDGVSAVVATFFKGQNSIAEKIEALFVPNEAGNLEATQPMVAIACAAIHSSLEDYSSGGHKHTNFEGSRIQEIYDLHIMILDKLKHQKPAQYHEIMEHIFAEASRGSSFAKGSKAPPTLLQKEALAMLDLSDSD
ncbi:hypothetical protein B0H11DRAFT_2222113 [Mycena galericulata]|nr:hypothetical protein B0H11DRAFT_2222113 [Mycena galericulata]